RASALQAEGRRFESVNAHTEQSKLTIYSSCGKPPQESGWAFFLFLTTNRLLFIEFVGLIKKKALFLHISNTIMQQHDEFILEA
ncbi:MAG TPA: hypothetical protein PLK40_04715, partial [Bacteroidaceae bacterium]|nr:hypothetical protein [Bacteroidaceae bacterium]